MLKTALNSEIFVATVAQRASVGREDPEEQPSKRYITVALSSGGDI